MTEDYFSDIRPYNDSEVKCAIRQLIKDPTFISFARYLFPDFNRADFVNQLKTIETVSDFQKHFVVAAVEVVVKRSIKELSSRGLEQLKNLNEPFLFISNHRDIVLDSALINLLLYRNGFTTSEIAIGGNLLISPMIVNLVKINKSFIVQRYISPKAMYEYSKKLSAYIYHVLYEKKSSVWIAQRQGRAKDGNDRTQIALLKMLLMKHECDHKSAIMQLPIIPVSVSYEYDPCDALKAVELYHKENNLHFQKTPEYDFESMIEGIQGYKGRVEVAFCNKPDFSKIPETLPYNDFLKTAADIIDENIHLNYRLWKTNYIAYDLLHEPKFTNKYNDEEKADFVNYIKKQTASVPPSLPEKSIFEILLRMYANPVVNYLNISDRLH